MLLWPFAYFLNLQDLYYTFNIIIVKRAEIIKRDLLVFYFRSAHS